MRRQGTDHANVAMSDVLCDFCHSEWTDSRPMIEGHLGACVCGQCLAEAYRAVILNGIDDRDGVPALDCTMCREAREEPARRSAAWPEAIICTRCITMATKALERDAQ